MLHFQRCSVVLVILDASEYPFGNLLVPDKAVPADFHVVLRCKVDQLITRQKIVGRELVTWSGMNDCKLHLVLGLELIKLLDQR